MCFLDPPSPPARRRKEAAVGARSDADTGRCVRAPPPCVGERGEAAANELVEEAARCVRAPGELGGSESGTAEPPPLRRRASRVRTSRASHDFFFRQQE